MMNTPRSLSAFGLAALFATLGLQGSSCTPRRSAATGQCVYNTDCAENLDCVLGVCRPQCQGDRDCPSGQRCATERHAEPGRPDDRRPTCVPDDEHFCLYDSDCEELGQGMTRCLSDGLCGYDCYTAHDCRYLERRTVCDESMDRMMGTHTCVECSARFPDCSRFGAGSQCDTSTNRCGMPMTPADSGTPADAAPADAAPADAPPAG